MEWKWKGDALAKLLILWLIVVIVINSCIIIGFQLMTNYPYDSSADALNAYADYNIIDSRVTQELSAYLLAAPAKENRLILTEKHFLSNRHRLLLDTEVTRHFSTEVKADLGTVFLRLEGQSKIDGLSFRPTSMPIRISTISVRVPLEILLWNFVFLAVELLVWYLIHKIRNG